MSFYNNLTYKGSVVENPPLVISFLGEEYGVVYGLDDQGYLDALVWQNDVPLEGYDAFVARHTDELVTLTATATGQTINVPLGRLRGE